MIETQKQIQQNVTMTLNEQILEQLHDLKENQRELRLEIKKINARMDKLSSEKNSSLNDFRIPNLSNFDLWMITVTIGIIFAVLK